MEEGLIGVEHSVEARAGVLGDGGHGLPSLPTAFLGGGAQVRALPQGILVIVGTAPAPALPTADTAHSGDAAGAVGHIAAADCAGMEAVASTATGAADDGCRGRARLSTHSGRAGVSSPQDTQGS